MAATNQTPDYHLSQFLGSDKPSWMFDYNGDMLKLDAALAFLQQAINAVDGNVDILQAALAAKQDELTFDATPTEGSRNPVTSGGIYEALQNAAVDTDAVPTEGSTKPVQSGGVYTALEGKQDVLPAPDSAPTAGSPNTATSGGIYSALASVFATAKTFTGMKVEPIVENNGSWDINHGIGVLIGRTLLLFPQYIPKYSEQPFTCTFNVANLGVTASSHSDSVFFTSNTKYLATCTNFDAPDSIAANYIEISRTSSSFTITLRYPTTANWYAIPFAPIVLNVMRNDSNWL